METNTRPIFPWYKERLQTKYLKGPANKILSVGSFVNVSLDDFSDCLSLLSRRGVSPVIFRDSPNRNSSQKPKKCISKEHACFSKQMIQKQIGREYVAAVEEKLKQHPLAMYSHYKDHMTPELFDKVVSVLDPDMSVNSASALPTLTEECAEEYEDDKNGTESREEDMCRAKKGTSANEISPDVQNPSPRNSYNLQMNETGIKQGRTSKDEDTNVNESAIMGSLDSDFQDSSPPTFAFQVENANSVSDQE